jgi:hypothetical protein
MANRGAIIITQHSKAGMAGVGDTLGYLNSQANHVMQNGKTAL